MFVALGLTVDLDDVVESDAWFQGLVLAALLAFVIRPLVVGALLAPGPADAGTSVCSSIWSGLKGAVPILLAALAMIGGVDDGTGSTRSSSSSSSSRCSCRGRSCPRRLPPRRPDGTPSQS